MSQHLPWWAEKNHVKSQSIWPVSPQIFQWSTFHINPLKSESESESDCESYVTTDSQSASLSWNEAPIWGLRPDIYVFDNYGPVLVGVLSHERTGLSFVYATGPRQCSPSWVWGPLVSRPYFTVSDLRLPFSSPPTTPRVDPASTRGFTV
jgi:hypothetical protein